MSVVAKPESKRMDRKIPVIWLVRVGVSAVVLALIFGRAVQGLGGGGLMPLVGKWFVFWAVGARLFIAGIRQVIQPAFTAASANSSNARSPPRISSAASTSVRHRTISAGRR